MKKLNIIKVGGKIVEEELSLKRLIDDFSNLSGSRILVHGGGRSATALAARMGIATTMIDGRRVTDADMLKIVTMVYGGLVNKQIVAALQSRGINAVGLTGADLDIIRSHRRPATPTVDYGFVGDIDHVDGHRLSTLIDMDIIPVIAPLSHDGNGTILNTNADTIASQIAIAMTPYYDTTLTFCFEKPGVLSNPDDDTSVIPNINPYHFHQLKAEGIISDGMIPKIQNSLKAIESGVTHVIITRADAIANPDAGTHITL